MRGPVALLLLLSGCYAPSIRSGQYSCQKEGSTCPSGFTCECKVCVLPGQLPDGCFTGREVGCSNGDRAGDDPGLPRVAICPAAWLLPGLARGQTPCDRKPTASGKSAGGVECSAEDNCGKGWHLCRSEAELGDRDFTGAHCEAIKSGTLYAIQQSGQVIANLGRPEDSTVSCSSGDQAILGCGTAPVGSSGCQVVKHGLFVYDRKVGGDLDLCKLLAADVWKCEKPAPSTVTKPRIDQGGVICCRD